jgi:hypothetical protein
LPRVIRQGNKLFQMSIKSSKHTAPLRFLDSFNIIPVKLANFPETFALNMEGKHYFPYNYNQVKFVFRILMFLLSRKIMVLLCHIYLTQKIIMQMGF